MKLNPYLTKYHVVALVLTGVGCIGIGIGSIPLYVIGALGLAMLLARPPRPPRASRSAPPPADDDLESAQ